MHVYKQQSSNTKVLEVCAITRCSLADVDVLLWRKRAVAWERTAWSEDPLGYKKNGWCQCAALFPGTGAGTLAEDSERGC